MVTQALFYEEVAPVSLDAHADLSIDAAEGYGFARRSNFSPLACVEFEKAAANYPIVFVQQADGFVPAAIFGFGDEDNLFLDADGRWTCEYIPGYIRRYPFILANVTEGQTFTLCIDPAWPGCNRDDRGERLFLIGGARSPYLERTLAFVQQFHGELTATAEFCRRLQSLDLLEPMQAQVALASGEKLALAGFHTVSRERLQALGAADAASLLSTGQLELVYLHLFSLAAFGTLMERHAERFGASAEAQA